MAESEQVPGKGRIRVSIENCSGENRKGPISASSEKWLNPGVYLKKVESVRIWKNISGEYREKVESVRVSKNCWGSTEKGSNQWEYRKMIESGRVPGKVRIRASIEKLSQRVPKKGRIIVSTEEW